MTVDAGLNKEKAKFPSMCQSSLINCKNSDFNSENINLSHVDYKADTEEAPENRLYVSGK